MKTLRHLSVLLLLLVVGGVCMACYSSKDLKAHGKRVTVTRDVGYFSKVDASGSVDIEFVQGKEQAMRIVGSKQFVDNIVVEKSAPTYYNNSYNNVVGNNIIIDSKPIIIQQNSIPSVIQIHRELEEMERRIKLNKLK